jgi:hypothetical protein
MSSTQQIIAIYEAEKVGPFAYNGSEVLRWVAFYSREDLGATSSQFADAMETVGVKRGTALNRWSDMVRNTRDD